MSRFQGRAAAGAEWSPAPSRLQHGSEDRKGRCAPLGRLHSTGLAGRGQRRSEGQRGNLPRTCRKVKERKAGAKKHKTAAASSVTRLRFPTPDFDHNSQSLKTAQALLRIQQSLVFYCLILERKLQGELNRTGVIALSANRSKGR